MTFNYLIIFLYLGTSKTYFISVQYKKDYVHLQAKFALMFDEVTKIIVQSNVVLGDLKAFLSRCFPEFVALNDAETFEIVMDDVKNNSSLTDFCYLDEIVDKFDLTEAKKEIEKYQKELDFFMEQKFTTHSYAKTFLDDFSKKIPENRKITFRLEWTAKDKTLRDVRNVLRTAFGSKADRVRIVVIEDGSMIVVCCASEFRMQDLTERAEINKSRLENLGVVGMRIGSKVSCLVLIQLIIILVCACD